MRKSFLAVVSALVMVFVGVGVAPAVTFATTGVQMLKGNVTVNGKPVTVGKVYADGKAGRFSAEIVDGRYAMAVEPGSYTVFAEPPWDVKTKTWLTTYAGNTVREVDSPKQKVEKSATKIVDIKAYDKVGRITGVIVDDKGKPVREQLVNARALNRGGREWAVTDKNGAYAIGGLPVGAYEVYAEHRWGVWAGENAVVKAGATAKANLKLPTAKSKIVVTVTGPKDLVKSACAVLFDEKGNDLWGAESWCLPWHGTGNKLETTALPAGKYTVTLPGSNTSKSVTVKKGKTAKVTLNRVKGATISGTVTNRKGKAVKGVVVAVTDSNGTLLYDKTNAKGKYKISGVTTGKYTVSVAYADAMKDGVSASKKVTLKGKKTTANIRLVAPATITGKVVNSKGAPVGGVVVGVDIFWDRVTGTTDAKGEYKLTGLPPDTYRVTVADQYVGGYFDGKSAKKKVAKGKTVKFPTIKLKG